VCGVGTKRVPPGGEETARRELEELEELEVSVLQAYVGFEQAFGGKQGVGAVRDLLLQAVGDGSMLRADLKRELRLQLLEFELDRGGEVELVRKQQALLVCEGARSRNSMPSGSTLAHGHGVGSKRLAQATCGHHDTVGDEVAGPEVKRRG
jgi:hypothetical protein